MTRSIRQELTEKDAAAVRQTWSLHEGDDVLFEKSVTTDGVLLISGTDRFSDAIGAMILDLEEIFRDTDVRHTVILDDGIVSIEQDPKLR